MNFARRPDEQPECPDFDGHTTSARIRQGRSGPTQTQTPTLATVNTARRRLGAFFALMEHPGFLPLRRMRES